MLFYCCLLAILLQVGVSALLDPVAEDNARAIFDLDIPDPPDSLVSGTEYIIFAFDCALCFTRFSNRVGPRYWEVVVDRT
jgi:hypothetical protein